MLPIRAALACLLMTTAVPLAAQTPPERQELLARLARHLDSASRQDRFAGVVLLADGDSVVFERAYGMADRERRRPITPDTRFNIGSINKMFTIVAIRQLAARGRLSLDDRLIQHLPDYPNRAAAEGVTLRQLMEHTAGLGGNVFGVPAGGSRMQLRGNNDFIPLFVNEPPAFAPGGGRRYCNVCYVLLGAVVERVSGMSYYEYIRANVYRPAGMTATDHYALDSLPANTAIGYTRGDEDAPPTAPLRPNTDELPGRGSAAGGGYATARDLFRFAQAARQGRIEGARREGIGAAGGTQGVNALIESELRGRYTLVVLSNLDPPAAERVGAAVRGWLGVRDD